jgi:hypothetical protein
MAGRIKSIDTAVDLIGNRNRELPSCRISASIKHFVSYTRAGTSMIPHIL